MIAWFAVSAFNAMLAAMGGVLSPLNVGFAVFAFGMAFTVKREEEQ